MKANHPNHHNKGQVAMEFILTYGWAILGVLLAIGTLAYFGVINPASYFTEKCIMAPGITCKDFLIKENSVDKSMNVYLTIENNLQETVWLNNVTISTKGNAYTATCIATPTLFVQQNKTMLPVCTFPAGSSAGVGQPVQLNVYMSYTGLAGGFAHPLQGEIQAKISS